MEFYPLIYEWGMKNYVPTPVVPVQLKYWFVLMHATFDILPQELHWHKTLTTFLLNNIIPNTINRHKNFILKLENKLNQPA